jgi:hypothetical protein
MKSTMTTKLLHQCLGISAFACLLISAGVIVAADDGALLGQRHRVVVSSDVGGTDQDDFQSMVHLLVYADNFVIEGLISSPFGPGRRLDILTVIDGYERDYAPLETYSDRYRTADELRTITKQGAINTLGASGIEESTEGSQWIIECARRDESRLLNVLVWGGIEELAQALHDATYPRNGKTIVPVLNLAASRPSQKRATFASFRS